MGETASAGAQSEARRLYLESGQIAKDFVPETEGEFADALGSWEWRIFSGALYKITTKGDDVDDDTAPEIAVSFRPNPSQEMLLADLNHRNVVLKARQMGFCLAPYTRVLTADLRWISIDAISVGDELVAVDEHVPGGKGPSRKMRTTTVQAVRETFDTAYRIEFASGASVVCTGNHRWLARTSGRRPGTWKRISEPSKARLKPGCAVRRICTPWQQPGQFEDGWFGGMLDGEGSISKRNTSAGITVSQRRGDVWDRAVRYAEDRGYSFRIEEDADPGRKSKHGKNAVPKLAFGRLDEMFRLVGQTRPSRFLKNRFWEGRNLPGKRVGAEWDVITDITELEPQRMIDIQTDCKTFIAEGLVSHNSTLIEIMALDHAMFNADQEVVVIAHTKDAATKLYRKKVCFAYDNLPASVRDSVPFTERSQTQMVFANGSSIEVTSSARGGTPHFLHISEMGKIAAKYPEKAVEITTGSLQGVPKSGLVFIESTAEGKAGAFYDISQRAEAMKKLGKKLKSTDYRFHFFAWWKDPSYRLDPEGIAITAKEHEYFDGVEVEMDTVLDLDQRAWYVNKRDNDFSSTPDLMWREYPSTPDECWQASAEGKYYAVAVGNARISRRIGNYPLVKHVPANTFWDIGATDHTAIWVHQRIGAMDRWTNFYEESGKGYLHFILWLEKLGCVWGAHYLPHDSSHNEQDAERITSPITKMREIRPQWDWRIVPRVKRVQHGIDLVNLEFDTYEFDEEGTKEGISHLEAYSRGWSNTLQWWTDDPRHDEHSHCADAFRQKAQGYTPPGQTASARNRPRPRATGLTA